MSNPKEGSKLKVGFIGLGRMGQGMSKRILDAGCGNGRYSKFILKEADPDAFLTGFDLSQRMLKRARRRNRGSVEKPFPRRTDGPRGKQSGF